MWSAVTHPHIAPKGTLVAQRRISAPLSCLRGTPYAPETSAGVNATDPPLDTRAGAWRIAARGGVVMIVAGFVSG